MKFNIVSYIQEEYSLTESLASEFWSKAKRDVDKFSMNKGFAIDSSEYYALSKWYIKTLMGKNEGAEVGMLKTFKQFLIERGSLDAD